MTDQNLGQTGSQLVPSRGKVRGLMIFWAATRMRRDRIWLSVSPTLGHGRAVTLALLSEMVVQNAIRRPGNRSFHLMGRGLADINGDINYPVPSMGRARAENPRIHSHVNPPLCLPYPWPQCLCRCRCPLSAPPSPPGSTDSTDPFFRVHFGPGTS